MIEAQSTSGALLPAWAAGEILQGRRFTRSLRAGARRGILSLGSPPPPGYLAPLVVGLRRGLGGRPRRGLVAFLQGDLPLSRPVGRVCGPGGCWGE